MAVRLESEKIEELTEGLQEKLAEVQKEYNRKIKLAQLEGDLQKLQDVMAEMQAKIQEVSEAYQKTTLELVENATHDTKSPERKVYDHTLCDVDLELLSYDGDRDLIIELGDDPSFQEVLEMAHAHEHPFNSRKELLKSSLRMSPKIAPHIHEMGENCRKTLGLKAELEFYVYQDTQFNAFCYPPREGQIYIMLTSGILEKFTNEELQFVIGHEIGHFLMGHHRWPIQMILQIGAGRLSPVQAMKLYSWKRNAEISADRIGLLCSKNFEAVSNAFFKLSSGVTDSSLEFKVSEYIDQFKDLRAEMVADNNGAEESIDPQDWYSTHPLSPMRIQALELFRQSETYHTLIGQDGGTITEGEMEKEIKAVMSLMEPSYLNDNSELSTTVQQFLFIAGYAIAAANGVVEDSEVESLGSIVKAETFSTLLPKVTSKSVDELMHMAYEEAKVLNLHMNAMSKLNIIKDLSVISYADGSIDEEEVQVLYGISQMLGIYPDFVDQVLHDAGQGMD